MSAVDDPPGPHAHRRRRHRHAPGPPRPRHRHILHHNLAGGPGTEIVAELRDPRDLVVHGKQRYSSFHATDLEFVLRRTLGADTVILAGINTTTCVLCAGFEATNLDFRVIVAADAVDSMDGEEMHRFALRLMGAAIGWPMANADIFESLSPSGG